MLLVFEGTNDNVFDAILIIAINRIINNDGFIIILLQSTIHGVCRIYRAIYCYLSLPMTKIVSPVVTAKMVCSR